MDLVSLAVQLLNGVQYGLLLFLVASGLTLVFGILGVINLAHGSFYMLGAYLAYSLCRLYRQLLACARAAASRSPSRSGSCSRRSSSSASTGATTCPGAADLRPDPRVRGVAHILFGNDVHCVAAPAFLQARSA